MEKYEIAQGLAPSLELDKRELHPTAQTLQD